MKVLPNSKDPEHPDNNNRRQGPKCHFLIGRESVQNPDSRALINLTPIFGSIFNAIKIAEYESGVGETHSYLPMCQSFSLLPIFLDFL